MAIDLSNILSIYAGKVSSLDSNTPLSQMVTTIQRYVEFGGKTTASYDSVVDLPYDSALQGMIVSVGGVLRNFNGNNWDMLDSDTIVDPAPPWTFGGTISGYTSGGATAPTTGVNTIDKFSFTSDGNATDVGDLTIARMDGSGQSSSVSGYTSGGFPDTKVIDKFPFASDGNAVSVGNLTNFMYGGSSHHTETYGYHGGGYWGGNLTAYSNINQISFATDGDATTVGNLSTARYPSIGQSSSTDGYSMTNTIRDKFPFANGGTAVDLGNLPTLRFAHGAGQSSDTDGYYVAMKNDYTTSFIDKYPFASDTFASSVGTMTVLRYYTVGQSSTTYGYTTGGVSPVLTPSNANIVDKFSFVSGGNATDVGDVTISRFRSSGQQY